MKKPHRRRAMTLLEVLLSIAIVAMLLGVFVAWLPTASRAAGLIDARRATNESRDAVFALIGRDLAVGDAPASGASRVEVLPGGVLRVETRSREGDRSGRVMRELRHDPGTRTLEVRDRRPDGVVTRRTVATGIRTWDCVRPEGSTVIDVTIDFDSDPEATGPHTRRFSLR